MASSAVALLIATSASANSTIEVFTSPTQAQVGLTAAAGKANDLTAVVTETSVTVTDPVDPIDEAEAECSGGGTNSVVCTFATPITFMGIDAADLDDSISVEKTTNVPTQQIGGNGSDEITVVSPPGAGNSNTIFGDENGNDLAGDGNDTITGGRSGDFIVAGGGADILLGGEGDDFLLPGAGDGDRADGGSGDDIVSFALGHGTGDLFDGGEGTDRLDSLTTASFMGSSESALAVDLAVGTFNQTVGGSAAGSATGFEFFTGSGTAFTVNGTDGHNDLTTGTGADVVDPRAGADRVEVGEGADRVAARDGFGDRIECGPGVDTVEVDQFDELFDCEDVLRADVRPAGVELDAPVCTLKGVRRTLRRKRFLRGLGPQLECNEAVTLDVRLTVGVRRRRGRLVTVRAGQLVLAERALPLAAGTRRVNLKVPRRLRRVLGRRFTATLSAVAHDQFGNRRKLSRVVRVR